MKVRTASVIRRPFGRWQFPAFGRFEIATSAFGLLAMTILYVRFFGCRLGIGADARNDNSLTDYQGESKNEY